MAPRRVLRRDVLERALMFVALAGCGGTGHVPANPTPNHAPTPSPAPSPRLVTTALSAAPVEPPARSARPVADARAERPTFAVLHALRGIDVVESVNHASHMHGGDAASIHDAALNVLVTDGRVHTVKVTKLELLRGHCRTTTWASRTPLGVTGYTVNDWDSVDPLATGTSSVTLPAKSDLYSVTVSFDGVSAYQACDRFAFAVSVVVDGTVVAIEVPLQIKRYEPLRNP